MLPTVCFYKEFHCRSKKALKFMESKSHLKETPVFLYRIMDDLTDVVLKLEKESKPKCDQALIKTTLNGTDDFFRNIDKKKFDELKLSVSLASNVTPNTSTNSQIEQIGSLTNDDLELLMCNFDELDRDNQNDLLKMLLHIKETDYERYKMLKSPF